MTKLGRLCIAAGALLLLLRSSVPSLAQDERDNGAIIDQVVATLDDSPILLSDVLMEKELGLLETGRPAAGLEALLEPFLNRLMIHKEIEEVGSFRLSQGQFEGALTGFLASFGRREDFERRLDFWGIDEQEFRRRLNRALTVSLYTESRIQFFARVLPSDIERTYNEEPERWGGRLLHEVWDDIREILLEEAFTKERERWLATLRNRYHLEILVAMDEG
ncbi:MAG: hypothetical protein JSV26_07120 [bacterium]|nr:MAG: hypothetical protein JSV26_07120 [bacterium]